MAIKFPTLTRLDPQSLPAQAVERIQEWGAEVSRIGDAVVSLITKERAAADAALAATNANLANTNATAGRMHPVMHGFVDKQAGVGGFNQRITVTAAGVLTGAASGWEAIPGNDILIRLNFPAVTMANTNYTVLVSPYRSNGADWLVHEYDLGSTVRTTTRTHFASVVQSTSATRNLGNGAGGEAKFSFAIFGQTA